MVELCWPAQVNGFLPTLVRERLGKCSAAVDGLENVVCGYMKFGLAIGKVVRRRPATVGGVSISTDADGGGTALGAGLDTTGAEVLLRKSMADHMLPMLVLRFGDGSTLVLLPPLVLVVL